MADTKISDEIHVLMDLNRPTIAYQGFYQSWDVASTEPKNPLNKDLEQQTWVDPLSGTLMLRPLPFTKDWTVFHGKNSNGDNYAKGRITDWFTIPAGNALTDSDLFQEVQYRSAGDYWVDRLNTYTGWIGHKADFQANQPFYFSFLFTGSRGDSGSLVNIKFGQYELHILGNGLAMLDLVADDDTHTQVSYGSLTDGKDSLAGEMFDLLILPIHGHSILFYSHTHGGGWLYRDPKLKPPLAKMKDNSHTGNVSIITNGYPLMMQFPHGVTEGDGTAMFQAGPCPFVSIGEYYGPAVELKHAPATEQTFTADWHGWIQSGTGIGYTLRKCSSLGEDQGTFTPDGAARCLMVHYVLIGPTAGTHSYNGQPTYTPFVYGGHITFDPVKYTQPTAGFLDVTLDVKSLRIDHDYEAGASGEITLRKGATWEGDDQGIPCFRMCKVYQGARLIFAGFATDFTVTMNPCDDCITLSAKLISAFEWIKDNQAFVAQFSMDGLPMSYCMEQAINGIGGVNNYSIPYYSLTMESGGLTGKMYPSVNVPGRVAKRSLSGDTVDAMVRKIVDQSGWIVTERGGWTAFASRVTGAYKNVITEADSYTGDTWFVSVHDPEALAKNTPIKFYLSHSSMAQELQKTTFTSDEEAHIIRSMVVRSDPPEANELSLVYLATLKGETPQNTSVPVNEVLTCMTIYDSDSQDRTLAGSMSRPQNWLGVRKPASKVDKYVNSDTLAFSKLCAYMSRRGTMDRTFVFSFEAEFDSSVYPGDWINIPEIGDMKVSRMSWDVKKDADGTFSRSCNYIAESTSIYEGAFICR